MTRARVITATVLALAALNALVAPAPAGAAAPTVSFTLLTPLPTQLAVGETAVIGVHVESSEPFVMAIALSDAYYPGRGVSFDGSSAQPGGTSADLYLTVTGRASTAELAAVQNWPAEEDWAAGAAPLAVRVGARFAGGGVASATFLFAVVVA